MNNKEEKTVYFEGIVQKQIYESNGFRMYGIEVDKNKYDVKLTKYGNATIKGDLHKLSTGMKYKVEAQEIYDDKYGYSYKVLNIKNAEKPRNETEVFNFLQEILTFNQAAELYKNYPNFIELIENKKTNEIDVNKLHGIGEVSLQKIIKKVEENYIFADLFLKFKGIFSYSTINKLYQKYPSTERIEELLLENPYKFLTSLDRFGFKRADNLILDFEKKGVLKSNEPLISSGRRCMAYVKYCLYMNEEDGNTKMSLRRLQQTCKKEVPECVHHLGSVLKKDIFHIDKEELSISLMSTWNIEKYLAKSIKNNIKIQDQYNVSLEEYRQINEEDLLTDEQIQGLKNFCKYTISIIDGPAGSGKTATTKAVVNLISDLKKSVLLLAPTGRAAQVMSEYTTVGASTIHRGLGYNPKEGWFFNRDNKLLCDVVIVDEFSMVDIYLFRRLIDAIDFKVTKLLIIGDSAQLNSVQPGNCLHDMLDSKVVPTTTLTKIFRYSEGGLMTVATDTRLCKPYLNSDNVTKKVNHFGKNKDYAFIKTNNSMVLKDTVAIYKSVLSSGYDPEDVMVLSAYNKGDYGTVVLNQLLQKIANPNSLVKDNGFKAGEKTLYINDLVLQNKNNYRSTVYDMENDESTDYQTTVCNGEIGKVVKIVSDGVVIKFDHNYVIYKRKTLSNMQLGYAISIHKSQGGNAKVVIITNPSAHTYMLNSNLLYVALTRMKEKCYHLSDVKSINIAVKKKENLTRMTYLRGLLEGKYSL